MLGFAPGIPLPPMKRLFPLMWGAFALTAFSGIVLLMTETSKATMPVFLLKLTFIALAIGTLRLIYLRVLSSPQAEAGTIPPGGRMLAIASLMFWVGATIAGRLMAYLTPAGGGF